MGGFVVCNIFLLISSVSIVGADVVANTTQLPAFQSSTINGHTADLALDGDPETCSLTGFEVGSWWKVDLGQQMTVSGLEIQGFAGTINVRVGNMDEMIGHRRGFDTNPLCALFTDQIVPSSMTQVMCNRVLEGQHVSIQAVNSLDTSTFTQMQLQLCDVKILAI